MSPKTKKIVFRIAFVLSLFIIGTALVFGWLIYRFYNFGTESTIIKHGNPPITYVLKTHTALFLEGDVEKPLAQFDENSNLEKLVKYENPSLGISFDYPEAYKNTACDVTLRSEGSVTIVRIGSRIELSIDSTNDSNTDIFRLIKEDLKDVEIGKQTPIAMAGKNATQVSYRFGGMNRYGETIYLINNHRLFKLGFTAGGFACGFEPGVYEKVVKSFSLN